MPSSAPEQPGRRRPDIQGLRAVAILFVVVFHAGLPVPGGFVGVDVFFVISGFVITAMLRRTSSASGRIDLPRFYARRFRRLTPALALMVAVTMVLSALILSPIQGQDNAAHTALGAMLLVANIVIANTTGGYFDAAADINPLLHTWSLSVEEQFYLVFPLVLMVGWWLGRRLRLGAWGPVLTTAVVAGLSLLLTVVIARGGYGISHLPAQPFYSSLTRAWEFGAGALLALIAIPAVLRGRTLRLLCGLAGALLLAVSLHVITSTTTFPGFATLLPVVGTVLLIHAGLADDNPVTRLLSTRPLVWIGDISYSWYLWHWPLIVFAALLWPGHDLATELAALVSLGPAVLSYRYVEQPIRSLRSVGWKRMGRIVVATLVPPLALAALLLVAVNQGFWSTNVRDLEASVDSLHAAAEAGCTNGLPTPTPTCVWNGDATGKPIYVIGDSNADQFSEALIRAGQDLGRPVLISTFNGCSFLGRSWSDSDDAHQQACRAYVDGTLGWLAQAMPGDVVIGISDSLWVDPHVGAGPDRVSESDDPKIKHPYLESDLQTIVQGLQGADQSVLLLQPIPKPQRVDGDDVDILFDPTRCTTLGVLRGRCPSPVLTPRALADQIQAAPRAAIEHVARATGAQVLDLRAFFCPHDVCSTHRDGEPLFRDGGHISVTTSAALAPEFEQAVR